MTTLMKDSGIDWIGEIPEGWKIVKLKDISVLKKGEVFDSSNAKPDGLYPYINGGIKPSDYSDNYNVKENSIAVSEGGASAGYSQFVESKFWAGTHCYVVTPKYKNIKKYIYYILKGFSGQIMMEKTGSALPNLQKTRFSNFIVSYTPVLETQQKIANYLDIEVTKLDKQISLLEKKHILLGDYKEALIFETVTKGLDKEVAMKDSGVDWIGEIPEGWKVKRLKDLYDLKKGINAGKFNFEYVRSEENKGVYPVYSGQTENNGVMGKINTFEYDDKSGSILTTTVGAKAMTVRKIIGNYSLSQNCGILKSKIKSDINYSYYLIYTSFAYAKSIIPSHMQPSFRKEDLNNILVPYVNLEIQQKIADYLDIEVTKLDKQRELIKKKVELLKQYKEALIFEVVTGKKEVE